MLTRRSLYLVLASVVLTIVAVRPTADAAQTQAVTATTPLSRREIAPQDTRAQAELEKRVQSLEKQVEAFKANEARMQTAMTALERTVATLQANALPVQRQGANYIVHVPAGLTLHAANMTVQGDAAMALKTGVKLDVNAAVVNVAGQSRVDLKGGTILLNAGSNGKSAVRSGDQVACTGPLQCKLVAGSPTVLIGP
ncbi:MAG TPA: hypothetical protein VFR95_04480 [Gemmatimonadaceae bacterium]|nr:hypothetical protein [Gemmatimonadaceae bacterium]